MKRIAVTAWLFLSLCLLALAGCGREETENGGSAETDASAGTETGTEAETPIVLTGEYVPVAEFANPPMLPLYLPYPYFYKDGEIIFRGDGGEIRAYAVDGTGSSRVVMEAECGEDSGIPSYYIDGEDNLYVREDERFAQGEYVYYLRKIDKEGRELWRSEAVWDADGNRPFDFIYVDGEGNIALVDTIYDRVRFFDREGQYRGQDIIPLEDEIKPYLRHDGTNNLIRIGEQYFLWKAHQSDAAISLWEVDFANCRVLKERIVDMASFGDKEYQDAHKNSFIKFDGVLFDGGELGLLVSTEDVLWQYDMETGASTALLRWDERFVGINGLCIGQIDVGEAGEGGIPLDVVVYNDNQSTYTYATPEVARITYVDKAYIKESKVVRIGLDSRVGGIEQVIHRFNRSNSGYEAVLVDYDASMLKDMLSYGKEIPDILDVGSIRTGWLENKNLLEDLTPYFAKSSVVNKEDILPAVWEILEGEDGKLTKMATGFWIRALTTAADLPEDGWTYDQFLSLEEQYPGTVYMKQHTPTWVWGIISMTGVEEFIDWEKRKCSFDSREFRNLIEKVNSLDYPRNQRLAQANDTMGLVLEGRVLMQFSNYYKPYDYEQEQEESGGKLKTICFPTMDGEPVYIFTASQSLAIYGESSNKEGAWAFLEFLLSEEEQSWYGGNRNMFPVNANAFEAYLSRPNNIRLYADSAVATEETQEKLRYMASHMVLNQNAADEISSIINEELQAYFAGDKTAKEAAKIIQNRVQLYLDEM